MRTVSVWAVVIACLFGWSSEARAQTTIPRIVVGWERMYGVDGPFVGGSIRGVEGDELPWEVGHVRGVLRENGRLVIDVRGLVFTHDDIVPPALRGINDEPFFRAVVSCLSENEAETHVVLRNVITRRFPATPSGDAHIEQKLELPEACVAPIVFIVGGSEGAWFAVTGVEVEAEPD